MAFCLGNPLKVDIPYKNDKGVKNVLKKLKKNHDFYFLFLAIRHDGS